MQRITVRIAMRRNRSRRAAMMRQSARACRHTRQLQIGNYTSIIHSAADILALTVPGTPTNATTERQCAENYNKIITPH